MGDGLLSRRRWPAEPSRARVPGGQGRAGTCSPARAGQVCPAPQPGQCPCPLCSGTPSLGGPAEAPEPGGREGRVGEGPGEAERGPQEGRWQESVLDRCSPLPYPPDFQNLEQSGCESAPNYHCTKFLEDRGRTAAPLGAKNPGGVPWTNLLLRPSPLVWSHTNPHPGTPRPPLHPVPRAQPLHRKVPAHLCRDKGQGLWLRPGCGPVPGPRQACAG